MNDRKYPYNASDVICDKKYKPEVLRTMRSFKREHFYAGDSEKKKGMLLKLHGELCTIYEIETNLKFNNNDEKISSRSSHYSPVMNYICLQGRFSVITYLHEFAHAVWGANETKAVKWSVNLYRRIYPVDFAKLQERGHVLIKRVV